MRTLPITIASLSCLFLVAGIEIDEKSLKTDDLDVISVSNLDSSKSTVAQRKRDSGYSYDRPVRLLSTNHREIVRGRILVKRPSGQTSRPFAHYGPPNYRNQPLKSQNHNGHQQQQLNVKFNGRGQTQQDVPSPSRDYEFVEPSPIAEQNSIPFNSNAANYLPPRNQKLPYLNGFPKREQSPNRQIPPTTDQTEPTRQQSQNLLGGSFSDHQQISDGATFLTQNSQAISQLYETPATNLDYEPVHESHQSSQNSGFQAGNSNPDQPGSNQDTSRFPSNLPSYASGFLESREAAIRDVQSLEKDRLIVQLQRALIDAQSNTDFPPTTSVTSVRYAQNHVNPSYLTNENHHQGYQVAINPSVGPQLDRPKNHDNGGPYRADFGHQPLNSVSYTYGPPSTTPANQAQITTTLPASMTGSSMTQQPNLGTSSGEASSQVPTSITPVSSTPNRLPQYGFVPSFIGASFIPNYPTYPTNFVNGASTIHQVPSSAPTHFGIPIPSLGPSQTVPTNSGTFGNNDGSSGHQQTSGTSLQPIHPVQSVQPVRPIQPIIPINSVHHGFNVVPTVTQIHPIQTVPSTLGQPTYGLQPVVNPIITKPIKAVYPIYYYPNVFQIQKSETSPWNYAPSFSQTRQAQNWK